MYDGDGTLPPTKQFVSCAFLTICRNREIILTSFILNVNIRNELQFLFAHKSQYII